MQVFHYDGEGSFGELALLYNTPRLVFSELELSVFLTLVYYIEFYLLEKPQ